MGFSGACSSHARRRCANARRTCAMDMESIELGGDVMTADNVCTHTTEKKTYVHMSIASY